MSSAARHPKEHLDAQPRVLLAGGASELEQVGEQLLSEGLVVNVARSEEDLLQLLAAVDAHSMPEPDVVVLEARLLGPPSLRVLRTLRIERPRVGLIFVAAPEDCVSRVIAAHLGGRVVGRPLRMDAVCAAVEDAAARRAGDMEIADQGPPSGVRLNAGLPERGKERARS